MELTRAALLGLGSAAAVQALVDSASAQAPAFEGAVSIAGDPQFGDQRATLVQLVRKNGQPGPNELCVIGQDIPGGDRQAWVWWKQGRSIILWEPPASGLADLALSRRYIRLPRDVAADRQGSSFAATPAWIAGLEKACAAIGQHFTIVKD